MEPRPSDDIDDAALGGEPEPVKAGATTDALDLIYPRDLREEGCEWVAAQDAIAGVHERVEPDPVMDGIAGGREPLQHLQGDLSQTLPAKLLADLAHRQLRRKAGYLLDRMDRVNQRLRLLPRLGRERVEVLDALLYLGKARRQDIAFELGGLQEIVRDEVGSAHDCESREPVGRIYTTGGSTCVASGRASFDSESSWLREWSV